MMKVSFFVLLAVVEASCFYLPASHHQYNPYPYNHHPFFHHPSFFHHQSFYPFFKHPYPGFYPGKPVSSDKADDEPYIPPVFIRSHNQEYPARDSAPQPTPEPTPKPFSLEPYPALDDEGVFLYPPFAVAVDHSPSHKFKGVIFGYPSVPALPHKTDNSGKKDKDEKSEDGAEKKEKDEEKEKKEEEKIDDKAGEKRVVLEGGKPGGSVDEQIRQLHFADNKGFFNYDGEYEEY